MYKRQLQLNAYGPFLLQSLLKASQDLTQALEVLSLKLLPSLGLDTPRMEKNLAGSQALLNALVPHLGYARVKELGKKWKEGLPPGGATVPALAQFLGEETGVESSVWENRLSSGKITGFTTKEEK